MNLATLRQAILCDAQNSLFCALSMASSGDSTARSVRGEPSPLFSLLMRSAI
ncbi:MAG TPA: hypothetical protein IGS17_02885 [Oscillatoriales cyanobacterium M59_W2019_021]|nr:hypothetical protein [Oscillatoriales cyanobacterium M4454_W2019_049]HIK49859.1 hypothetical protein [Oscillatoriales cyanobacterium M59_W2019_021]